jgi:hypothetical protein
MSNPNLQTAVFHCEVFAFILRINWAGLYFGLFFHKLIWSPWFPPIKTYTLHSTPALFLFSFHHHPCSVNFDPSFFQYHPFSFILVPASLLHRLCYIIFPLGSLLWTASLSFCHPSSLLLHLCSIILTISSLLQYLCSFILAPPSLFNHACYIILAPSS